MSGIGAALAVMNPYGATEGLPAAGAFLYWTGLIAAGYVLGISARSGLVRLAPSLRPAASLAIVSLLTGLGATAMVIAVHALFMPRPIPLSYTPTLFGLVWVIAAGMTGIAYMMERAVLAPPPDPAAGATPEARFLSRLPLKYRQAALWAVSSEDHYIRVHTSLGEELILMRLADAVSELKGADGLQVHRSWWIARAGLKDTSRRGGKLRLVLVSGIEVPVSRTYLPVVKAAGLAA